MRRAPPTSARPTISRWRICRSKRCTPSSVSSRSRTRRSQRRAASLPEPDAAAWFPRSHDHLANLAKRHCCVSAKRIRPMPLGEAGMVAVSTNRPIDGSRQPRGRRGSMQQCPSRSVAMTVSRRRETSRPLRGTAARLVRRRAGCGSDCRESRIDCQEWRRRAFAFLEQDPAFVACV